MSGYPTPRLGRAVRLFTPVVLAGALAVPVLSPAKEHVAKEKAPKGKPAPNVIVPAQPEAESNDAAQAQQPEQQQQEQVTTTQQAPAAEPVQSEDTSGEAQQKDTSSADDQSASAPAEAPGFSAASTSSDDHGDDDHGDDGHGDHHGDDHGDDHGKDKDKKDKKDKGKDKKDKKDKDKGKDDKDKKDKDKGKDDKDKKDKDKDKPGKDKDHGHKDDDKGHHKPGKDKDKDKSKPGDSSNSSTSSQPAAAVPTANLSPALVTAVNNAVAPRICTSRRSVTIRLDRGYKVRAARVLLNGKLVKVTRHNKRVTAKINLANRAKGTYTVRTVIVTKGNKIRIGTRKYMTCTPKRGGLTKRPRH